MFRVYTLSNSESDEKDKKTQKETKTQNIYNIKKLYGFQKDDIIY